VLLSALRIRKGVIIRGSCGASLVPASCGEKGGWEYRFGCKQPIQCLPLLPPLQPGSLQARGHPDQILLQLRGWMLGGIPRRV